MIWRQLKVFYCCDIIIISMATMPSASLVSNNSSNLTSASNMTSVEVVGSSNESGLSLAVQSVEKKVRNLEKRKVRIGLFFMCCIIVQKTMHIAKIMKIFSKLQVLCSICIHRIKICCINVKLRWKMFKFFKYFKLQNCWNG